MAEVRMTLEEYEAIRRLITSERESEGSTLADRTVPGADTKKPRKRSKYNRELQRQLKRLAVKHPRTKQPQLMSKAHAATRKALGMPARRRRK